MAAYFAINSWSIRQVTEWLTEEGLGNYIQHFQDNYIDGSKLLSLDERGLASKMGIIPPIHRRKILQLIATLKEQAEAAEAAESASNSDRWDESSDDEFANGSENYMLPENTMNQPLNNCDEDEGSEVNYELPPTHEESSEESCGDDYTDPHDQLKPIAGATSASLGKRPASPQSNTTHLPVAHTHNKWLPMSDQQQQLKDDAGKSSKGKGPYFNEPQLPCRPAKPMKLQALANSVAESAIEERPPPVISSPPSQPIKINAAVPTRTDVSGMTNHSPSKAGQQRGQLPAPPPTMDETVDDDSQQLYIVPEDEPSFKRSPPTPPGSAGIKLPSSGGVLPISAKPSLSTKPPSCKPVPPTKPSSDATRPWQPPTRPSVDAAEVQLPHPPPSKQLPTTVNKAPALSSTSSSAKPTAKVPAHPPTNKPLASSSAKPASSLATKAKIQEPPADIPAVMSRPSQLRDMTAAQLPDAPPPLPDRPPQLPDRPATSTAKSGHSRLPTPAPLPDDEAEFKGRGSESGNTVMKSIGRKLSMNGFGEMFSKIGRSLKIQQPASESLQDLPSVQPASDSEGSGTGSIGSGSASGSIGRRAQLPMPPNGGGVSQPKAVAKKPDSDASESGSDSGGTFHHRRAALPLPPLPGSAGTGAPELQTTQQQEPMQQPWFHPNMERSDAENVIRALKQDGSFVVRNSSSGGAAAPHTLTVLYRAHVFNLNIRFLKHDDSYALGKEKPDEKTFKSVAEMISHHQRQPIFLSSVRAGVADISGSTALTLYPTSSR